MYAPRYYGFIQRVYGVATYSYNLRSQIFILEHEFSLCCGGLPYDCSESLRLTWLLSV